MTNLSTSAPYCTRRRARRSSQRGVAIPAVLAAIAIAMVIGSEFATNTGVDLTAARNHHDAMRAQFLARSALNLTELVIRVQQRMDNVRQLGGIRITDYADTLLGAFCGSSDEVRDLVGVPLDKVKGLGGDIGTCRATVIESEDGKINLNCARGGVNTLATLKTRLDALMFFPAYDPVFQEEDATGWRRDRETQASALIDYVDADTGRYGSPGSAESYDYKPKQGPKNNYLDTKSEIRLIRGVDDRFWNLFGDSLTVYGGCKSNVKELRDPNLIASILYLAAKDPKDAVVQDANRLWMLAGVIAQAQLLGVSFSTLEDFIEFVADPAAAAGAKKPNPSGGTTPTTPAAPPTLPGVPPGTKVGIQLDPQKLAQIADAGPRRIYRVELYGEIERGKYPDGSPIDPPIRRTLKAVWDTKVTNQNTRGTQSKNGTWVYVREE